MDATRVAHALPDAHLAADAFEDLQPISAVLDQSGCITLVNRAWRRYYDQYARDRAGHHFVGTNYLKVCDSARGRGEEYAQRMADGLRDVLSGRQSHFRLLYPCREHDGQRWYVAWVARLSSGRGAVVTHLDVTDEGLAADRLKRLSQMVGDVDHLEQFGLRARSVAHDLRNSLTLILGRGEIALQSIDQDDPAVADIEGMVEATRKAAAFCTQMLKFQPGERVRTSLACLNQVVEETLDFIDAITPENIQIDTRLDARIPVITGESAQLHQVLVNLLVNAIQAIDQRPGRIVVQTGIAFRDRDSFLPVGDLEPADSGQYVFVRVSDSGPGIPREVMSQIFTPFYTTKTQGTGLGLTSALRILKAHSGVMELDSTPGKGTEFSLWLPFMDPPGES